MFPSHNSCSTSKKSMLFSIFCLLGDSLDNLLMKFFTYECHKKDSWKNKVEYYLNHQIKHCFNIYKLFYVNFYVDLPVWKVFVKMYGYELAIYEMTWGFGFPKALQQIENCKLHLSANCICTCSQHYHYHGFVEGCIRA